MDANLIGNDPPSGPQSYNSIGPYMSSFENATQSLCSIDGHLKHQTDVRNQDAQWTEPEVGHTKLVKLSCETGVGGQSGSCTTLTGMIDVNSLPVD